MRKERQSPAKVLDQPRGARQTDDAEHDDGESGEEPRTWRAKETLKPLCGDSYREKVG